MKTSSVPNLRRAPFAGSALVVEGGVVCVSAAADRKKTTIGPVAFALTSGSSATPHFAFQRNLP